MRKIFGLVSIIGIALWFMGYLIAPTDLVKELLPEDMQPQIGLLGTEDAEKTPEVDEATDLYEEWRFRVEVLSIQDGDTLTVAYPSEDDSVRIRLVGIDTPESDQPGGAVAKKYLSASIGSDVLIEPVDRDKYGRLLAVVWASEHAEVSVNYRLVRAGMAYRFMSDDPQLAEAEAEARQARLGVWEDPNAVKPSEWRQMKR